MQQTVQFVFVIHNHQPVGNFGHVIHEACDKSYLPFLRLMLEFPRLRFGLHTSGCLLEWLEGNRPEYLELLQALHARDQVELLGGGMYEPILPVLPERDALWQVNRLGDYLEQRFGTRPQGMWLPERVWEPQLPALLARAGLQYTLLDDYHFRGSALPQHVARDYFLTEHAGQSCALLPISKQLRYCIPFKPPQATLDELASLRGAAQPPLAVYGDDGEKFGVWPETYEWVFERGWLREFLQALDANLDWIQLMLPREVVAQRPPAGKVFIPTGSYAEMGEWTRVDPDAAEDDPPGFWRNFLAKYEESGGIYRKMLFVSELVARATGPGAHSVDDGGAPAGAAVLAAAQADLGRGQCNCAYWHGVFGGLYLNYLRHALLHHLLRAEQALAPAAGATEVHALDHDGLGWQQVLLRSPELGALLDPGHGLCLRRLDAFAGSYCWSNVLARRREHYHRKLLEAQCAQGTAEQGEASHSIHDRVVAKEEHLERFLLVDPWPRHSFVTYFSHHHAAAELLQATGNHAPPEPYFADYHVRCGQPRLLPDGVEATLLHSGLALLKRVQLAGGCLQLTVSNQGQPAAAIPGRFVVEFNFTLLTDQAPDRYLLADGQRHAPAVALDQPGCHSVALCDAWQQRQLVLASGAPFHLSSYPIYAVSASEAGFERTYQGTCVMLCFAPAQLDAGLAISLTLEELQP